MSKKLLIIDAGHNEYVEGKRSPDNSLLEWSFNNDMQKLIKSRAEAHGIEVYLTNPSPAKKDEIGLSTRCKLANNHWVSKNKPTTLFVSLHANAFGTGWTSANGTEVFVCKKASSSSVNAGKLINNQIVKDLGTKDRTFGKGVKYNDYYVIKNTNMPGVLIEYGFYSNKQEVEILKNKKPELVEATIKGICTHFGIKYVAPTTNNTTSTPSINNETVFKTGDYNKPVKVTTDSLNVRSGRGTSFTKLGTITKGTVITVWYIGKTTDGSLWGSISYNGNTGFIHMGYVEPTTEEKNENTSTLKPIIEGSYNAPLKVTTDSLNVRSGRGTKYAVVSTLKKGDIIDAWSIQKGDDGVLWASFRYTPATTSSNGIGYCSCQYLIPCDK